MCSVPIGLVPRAKEPGGFSVPNELVDLHAPLLGARGVLLYCILLRASTASHYPSVSDLRQITGISPRYVRTLLARLREFELLNDFDLAQIKGYHVDGTPAAEETLPPSGEESDDSSDPDGKESAEAGNQPHRPEGL